MLQLSGGEAPAGHDLPLVDVTCHSALIPACPRGGTIRVDVSYTLLLATLDGSLDSEDS
jgi:hypothetical protein